MTLKDFEGLPVTEAGIEIPSAAGGLRDAMRIAPVEIAKGDRVYVLLDATANKLRHDPTNKKEPRSAQRRVHILDVETAMLVDNDTAEQMLEDHRAAIAAAKEAEEAAAAERKEIDGQTSIDDLDDGDGPVDAIDDLVRADA